jgi:predicted nucleic acid-binding Zn ribbon protein
MEIVCHECGESFDIFKGGYSSQYVTACPDCWAVEISNRARGGVVVRN